MARPKDDPDTRGLYDKGGATNVQLIHLGFGVSLVSMSFQEVLWFIPAASFTLAAILMRKAAPFQRTAGDLTVKEAAVAEERARQFLAGEGLAFGLDDAARTSADIAEKPQAPRKRKRSVACGVIDRGPVARPFLSRNACPSAPGRYVAGVRGGVRRPRRLVFLDSLQ